MMDWDKFSEYYDWEFQQVCIGQKNDIVLWKRLAKRFGGPILEICCGSGRITKPLVELGYEIVALDYSKSLLKILDSYQLADLTTVEADMRDFELLRKFPFAFISYSSFQQLLTLEDQQSCLRSICSHLEDRGFLAFDLTPCLCEGADESPETLQYDLKYPKANSDLKLYSSHKIDRLNGIKHYIDHYKESLVNGEIKTFDHSISLKECTVDYMSLLLNSCGLKIMEIYGGFENEPLVETSNNLIIIAQKINES